MTTESRPEIGKNVTTGGFNTNYLEAGEEHSGVPVILMHGSGPGVTAYANWRFVIPVLAEHFHVYAPDMVGFGFSDRPEGFSYGCQQWADQILHLMDALGIEQANLIGNSFGGSNALRLATQHPDRVNRLVLMGSMGVDFAIVEGDGLDAVWGYEPSVENMARCIGMFAYGDELRNNADLAKVRYEASIQPGFQESFSAMFPAPRQRWVQAQTSPADQIRALPHPTLVVHGREDKVIPVSNSITLSQMIPNADLHIFAKCGHWSQIERQADFTRLCIDFFS